MPPTSPSQTPPPPYPEVEPPIEDMSMFKTSVTNRNHVEFRMEGTLGIIPDVTNLDHRCLFWPSRDAPDPPGRGRGHIRGVVLSQNSNRSHTVKRSRRGTLYFNFIYLFIDK